MRVKQDKQDKTAKQELDSTEATKSRTLDRQIMIIKILLFTAYWSYPPYISSLCEPYQNP